MPTEINNRGGLKLDKQVDSGKARESSAGNADAKANNLRSQREDVEISRDAQRLSVTINDTPAFDSDRVEQITRAIRDGAYPVNPDRIAQKFIELEAKLYE